MSAVVKYGVIVIAVMGAVYFVLMRETQISSPPDWPPAVHQYVNGFGTIRIVDSESRVTLFSYHGSDQLVSPVRIEKIDDNQWRVTFKKHNE